MRLDISSINVINAGVCEYSTGLRLQQEQHQLVLDGVSSGSIIVAQHEPVLTIGKNASESDVLVSMSTLDDRKVQIVRSDRGGKVTAHMPGQLIIYPILPISALSVGVKKYVNLLEESVVAVLRDFDLKAERRSCDAGVWVGERKICSLGVRVARRVSLHGLALNVCNNLDLFEWIVPCGLETTKMTSMETELERQIDINRVQKCLLGYLAEGLKISLGSCKLSQT